MHTLKWEDFDFKWEGCTFLLFISYKDTFEFESDSKYGMVKVIILGVNRFNGCTVTKVTSSTVRWHHHGPQWHHSLLNTDKKKKNRLLYWHWSFNFAGLAFFLLDWFVLTDLHNLHAITLCCQRVGAYQFCIGWFRLMEVVLVFSVSFNAVDSLLIF